MNTIPRTAEEYRAWWANTYPDISYGTCCCGCGEKTRVAGGTDRRQLWFRGEPVRYLYMHHKFAAAKPDWIYQDRGYETPCKIWQKAISAGYGMISVKGIEFRAHRLAYEAAHGSIPEGYVVHHLCQQKPCIEEPHLSLVTRAEHTKEHDNWGETHHSVKLTKDKVRKMRRLHRTGNYTHAALGRMFGVTYQAAARACLRLSWKHVD